MKLRLPKRRLSPIGLDVGARLVKAVQLSACTAGWQVHASVAIPRTAGQAFDAEEAIRIADVLDRQGFAGGDVIAGLGAGQLLASVLELPPAGDGVPLDQIARMELARVHQRDAESFEFAHWPIPEPARAARTSQTMSVACAHEISEAFLDALEAAGFHVVALDFEMCAIARACRPLLSGVEGMCALLDLGYSASRLAILHRGVICYSRVIDTGIGSLLGSLQQELGIGADAAELLLAEPSTGAEDTPQCDEANLSVEEPRSSMIAHFERIITELNVSFAYASHRYPDASLQQVLLVGGGGTQMPGLEEYLGEILGVTVCIARPETLLQRSSSRCESPMMISAIGLAMGGGARA